MDARRARHSSTTLYHSTSRWTSRRWRTRRFGCRAAAIGRSMKLYKRLRPILKLLAHRLIFPLVEEIWAAGFRLAGPVWRPKVRKWHSPGVSASW